MWPHNAVFQCTGKEIGPFPGQFLNKGKEPVTIARSVEGRAQELKLELLTSMATQPRFSVTSLKGSLTCVLTAGYHWVGQTDWRVLSPHGFPSCAFLFCCGDVYLWLLFFLLVTFSDFIFYKPFLSYRVINIWLLWGLNCSPPQKKNVINYCTKSKHRIMLCRMLKAHCSIKLLSAWKLPFWSSWGVICAKLFFSWIATLCCIIWVESGYYW